MTTKQSLSNSEVKTSKCIKQIQVEHQKLDLPIKKVSITILFLQH